MLIHAPNPKQIVKLLTKNRGKKNKTHELSMQLKVLLYLVNNWKVDAIIP